MYRWWVYEITPVYEHFDNPSYICMNNKKTPILFFCLLNAIIYVIEDFFIQLNELS